MEFLGIGPLELIAVLIIMLLVMGPDDMVKAGRTLGRFMRRIVTSETWLHLKQATREVGTLPNKLMKEAGLEEIDQVLKEEGRALQDIKQMNAMLAKDLDFDRMAKAIALGEALAQGESSPAPEETDTSDEETEHPSEAAPSPAPESPPNED